MAFPSLPRQMSVTICGTFNLALSTVADEVEYFRGAGLLVLSPIDPTPAEVVAGFRYIASDRHRDPMLVESRHLQAVATSEFVWLVAPDGYVGVSAATEVAYAAGRGVPVYTLADVVEPAVAALVRKVPSARAVVEARRDADVARPRLSFLVDPDVAADKAHRGVEGLHQVLMMACPDASARAAVAAEQLRRTLVGL